jgi:16S rRNA processing protein RimM
MPDSQPSLGRIQLGVIGRAHGVRGLVKVTSHTAEPVDLIAYGPLSDAEGRLYALRWMGDGIAEVSRIIDGGPVKITDRSQAEKLTNTRLFIDRSALPAAEEDEYYLTDLIGLTAVDPAGQTLGAVTVVHDYGAGASFEIVGTGAPLMVPFTAACVPNVDLAARRLVVVMPDEIVVPTDAKQDIPTDAKQDIPTDAKQVVPSETEHAA